MIFFKLRTVAFKNKVNGLREVKEEYNSPTVH